MDDSIPCPICKTKPGKHFSFVSNYSINGQTVCSSCTDKILKGVDREQSKEKTNTNQ